MGLFEADGDRPGNSIDLDVDAFNAALVLNWSVHDQIDLYGKLGAYYLDIESGSTIAGFRLGRDDSETEPYGAAGIEWDLGEINFIGEIAYVDTDVKDLGLDIASLGVKSEF